MKVCGIVAEYNPFHNGHKYHIQKSKEMTSCDAVIAVMSGNFVQRGDAALFDKWSRAKMAIMSGVDLVVELPTYYATASAEFFAQGSIGLLDSMGIVDYISFGAKNDDIDTLKKIANILYVEPDEYKELLRQELKKGVSFPVARSNALKTYTKKEFDQKYLTSILLDPNNILAIEYLKALIANNSTIEPVIIQRKGEDYNSEVISDGICSSTAIRMLMEKGEFDIISDVVPQSVFEMINSFIKTGRMPMKLASFEKEILYALRNMKRENLLEISDVSEGLENILKKYSDECFELNKLIDALKSKRYTRTRIQRILVHVLLNITKKEVNNFRYNPCYIRVLGFNKTGEKLLSQLYNKANIPVVTSVPKFLKNANSTAKSMIEKDILATDIYNLGYEIPNLKLANLDYTTPMIEV